MMTEKELITIVDAMETASVGHGDTFISDNQKAYKRFMGELYGNERKNRSKYVSTDVADVVEADMPALARVFMGAGEILEFVANTEHPDDLEEARQKNIYIPWILKTLKDSYKHQIDWLKCIEIYKAGVLEYGVETVKVSKKKKWEGISAEELTLYISEFQQTGNVKVIEHESYIQDGQEVFNVEISIVGEKKQFFLNNVPIEDLILTKNAQTKEDADIVGKRWTKTRSELIEEGFDKEQVKSLPRSKHITGQQLKDDRYRNTGEPDNQHPELHWTMEEVSGIDVYVKIDFDEDGIRERRHIVKSGQEILLNEDFDHVPYAITSAIQMPHNLIGRSRAEITMPTQWSQTVLTRSLLDNTIMSTVGRNVVSDKINTDDLLDVRENGIVRYRGSEPISNHIMPLLVPYFGDKTLQVIQYVDSKRAQTTGSLLANQGLEQSDLYKETATRTRKTDQAAKAKIELLCRSIAEIGYKQLYEGLAWFAEHHQNEEQEMYAMGQALKVNPKQWKYEHHCQAEVGTGAGDDEQAIQDHSALLSIMEQLKSRGSVLVDEMKLYNQLKRIAKLLGVKDISTILNNPEVPQELLMAQVEQLTMIVAQFQQMSQNPLAEAEQVKAQKELMLKAQELAQQDKQFFAKLFQEAQLKAMEMQLRREQGEDKVAVDLTRIETDSKRNIPGALI